MGAYVGSHAPPPADCSVTWCGQAPSLHSSRVHELHQAQRGRAVGGATALAKEQLGAAWRAAAFRERRSCRGGGDQDWSCSTVVSPYTVRRHRSSMVGTLGDFHLHCSIIWEQVKYLSCFYFLSEGSLLAGCSPAYLLLWFCITQSERIYETYRYH